MKRKSLKSYRHIRPIKRAFTLIEIIVCIVLLGLGMSLIGYRAKDLIARSKKTSEKSAFLKSLRAYQTLARCFDSDITLTVTSVGKGFSVEVRTEEKPCQEAIGKHQVTVYESLEDVDIGGVAITQGHSYKFVISSAGYIYPG